MRLGARKDITKRIGKQVKFGVLVFSRNGDRHHDVGSKAWVNSLIGVTESKRAIFIDDSPDHCHSSRSMNIPFLDVHIYKLNGSLKKLFTPYLE